MGVLVRTDYRRHYFEKLPQSRGDTGMWLDTEGSGLGLRFVNVDNNGELNG